MGTVVFVLAACADDSDVESDVAEGDGEDDGEQVSEGGDITVSTAGDVVSLDPHGSNDIPSEVVRNVIFDGMLGFSADGDIVNELATDYEQVDELTWEFNLREGVEFHDGSEFNAEVVEANIDRITDPLVGSERAFLLEMVDDVEIIDDYTVRIITEYAYAPLEMNLSHGAGKMISKEQIDEDYENALNESDVDMTLDEYYEARENGEEDLQETAGDMSSEIGAIVESNPVGTGYMQFDSRSPGDNTVLANYENYWDEEAYLDTITFSVVPETGARIAELESGTTEVSDGIGTENIERIEGADGINLQTIESNLVDYIGINVESEPLDDPRVRQAISHALNREEVISGIYNGSGRPAHGPLPPGMLGYVDDLDGIEYDMDRARELLEEAGYEDGFEISLTVNDESDERNDLAIWLQESLEELDITLNIEQMEWGAFLEYTGNGDHDMFTYGWNNSTGDPDNALFPLLHTDYIGIDGNRSFLSNQELDETLEDGRREVDDDTRGQIYTDAQELVVEEAPMIFVRYGENIAASVDGVNDVVLTQNGLYDFSNTTVE